MTLIILTVLKALKTLKILLSLVSLKSLVVRADLALFSTFKTEFKILPNNDKITIEKSKIFQKSSKYFSIPKPISFRITSTIYI